MQKKKFYLKLLRQNHIQNNNFISDTIIINSKIF